MMKRTFAFVHLAELALGLKIAPTTLMQLKAV
jgi:hypothetical protein